MAKRIKKIDVTDAELAVREVLWKADEQAVSEITASIYPQETVADNATVQTLLLRLEKKGCVQRDRRGRAHRFKPLIERNDLIGSQLRTVAEKLCGGSFVPLVTQLVEGAKLKPKERQAIRELLEKLED